MDSQALNFSNLQDPCILICLSGKRKSGKDYVASQLLKLLKQKQLPINLKVTISGISYPLKEEYAKLYKMDFEKLKSDDVYKELVRKDMVEYGEKLRSIDSGYFCRLFFKLIKNLHFRIAFDNAIANLNVDNHKNIPSINVVIISDCRRLSDINYFRKLCSIKTHNILNGHLWLIRIVSTTERRQERGYIYTNGIDDAETECGLDTFNEWDFKINNDGNLCQLQEDLETIIKQIIKELKA